MYVKASAEQVWNNCLGIKDRIAVIAHQPRIPENSWKNAFEQFSQSEQEVLLGIDWEMSTGKKFPQLILAKGETDNGKK